MWQVPLTPMKILNSKAEEMKTKKRAIARYAARPGGQARRPPFLRPILSRFLCSARPAEHLAHTTSKQQYAALRTQLLVRVNTGKKM